MITEEQNGILQEIPEEEVKRAVFGLNAESSGGPDGYTGKFFQSCWDIISKDLITMVRSFFCGHELPRYITCTNLVLIPKKKEITTFSDMRPISLSNITSKIFSRIIHNRLANLLPTLISPQQSGFIKGRSIVENILLVQEIVHDIRIRGKPANVVIKLDMKKAYDRVSWLFLTKILRKMGFGEILIDMVYRIISNNWYSILVNGKPQGFFRSTRGVKQGDPLSPTLFILAAECLTRALNSLRRNEKFKEYGMPKWSPYVNHLAYADDTIIFTSADKQSLKLVMDTLSDYEKVSGQKINKAKSAVYMHHQTPLGLVDQVYNETNIPRKDFPFTYLGVPIYYGRRLYLYYKELMDKVQNRLSSWTGKLLSFGGRTILIKHVLQSMPIHLLSACDPPAGVLAQLHRMFARFFWSNSIGNSSRHWSTWTTLCHPQEEGGVGFKSLQDISKALFAKLWWNMRTKQSLWRDYMSNKYLKKHHAVLVQAKTGTYIWKKMIKCRDEIEKDIWWLVKQGNSYFWLDNWTGLGALCHIIPTDFAYDKTIVLVKETTEEGQWHEQTLRRILPQGLAEHILKKVNPPREEDGPDRPYWKQEPRGKFTVGSAFQFLRQRQESNKIYKLIWIKGIPIKISFFMWRLWKAKLPLDDTLKKWGIQFPSRCYCCEDPKVEDIHHVFLHAPAAQQVWRYFCRPVGINIQHVHLSQLINMWWELHAQHQVRYIFQAVPSIIVWELWKRRNALKHGGKMSHSKVIYQVMHSLIQFMRTRRKNFRYAPYKWESIVGAIYNYSHPVRITKVSWIPPDTGWIKINTDGASRGNPGRSSWGFCARDLNGDIIQAQAKDIEDPMTTNIQAEAMAILYSLKYIETTQVEKVIIETDSLVLKNIIEKVWEIPWKIIIILEEIWRLMMGKTVVFNHIFREGNKVADHLANLALDEGPVIANNFQELEVGSKRLVNSDKLKEPYLRVRPCRR